MPTQKDSTPRVDRVHRKTDRAIELFLLLQRSKFRIPISQLTADKWGSRKTITRTVAAINRVWGRMCGEILVEIVREDGSTMGPGERYLQLVDHNLRGLGIRGLAVYQAYMGIAGVLRDSVIHDMMAMQFDRLKAPLLKSERAKLARMSQKFYAAIAHEGHEDASADILTTIFDALIDERLLEAEISTSNISRLVRLKCLTLFSKHDQLYLLAEEDEDADTKQPMIFPLSEIMSAKVLTHRSFTYPLSMDPGRILQELHGMKRD